MTVGTTTVPLKRWEQKELVQSLRRQGLSYREILAQVPFSLSRSTISSWCKDIELTAVQLDRLDGLYREGSYRGRLLGPKATQRRRQLEVDIIRAQAGLDVPALTKRDLWVAGLMLYWAEGDKKESVGFSNSNQSMVCFMMRWFREVCGVPEKKFRAQIHLHTGQDEQAIKHFWSQVTNIPLSQFGKSYVKREGTGHRKNILYKGTIHIRIHHSDLLQRIHGWIEGFSELTCGPIAQLVEQLPLKQRVAGSIPARPSFFDSGE